MKLFKNGVGRPSNEILQKRKRFYIIITFLFISVICCIGLSYKYFSNSINAKEKNLTSGNCVIPYTTSNCKYARNETVKQIQKMLNKLGFYKESYGYDGNFGPKTVTAVKDFQKSQGVGVDGSVGPDTLERLAKATNTAYFKIKYDKNGGTGSLKSNTQIILYGVPTKINAVKLSKANSTHVGYTASVTMNGITMRYGCFGKNCSSNYRIYTNAQIKANSKPFNEYVYSIGEEFSNATWMTGQEIKFTAKYCNKDESYNKTTRRCETNSNSNTNNNANNNSSSSSNNTAKEEFKRISALADGNSNAVMLSIKDKIQERLMCYEYALAYGSMILRNSTEFPSVPIKNDYVYGADVGLWPRKSAFGEDLGAIIRSQIDKGIPVMIHTQYSSNQHWILVVGYKIDATDEDLANNLKTHLQVIDPWGVKENGENAIKIATISQGRLSNQWQHSDGRYITWSSASKATR